MKPFSSTENERKTRNPHSCKIKTNLTPVLLTGVLFNIRSIQYVAVLKKFGKITEKHLEWSLFAVHLCGLQLGFH